ncbi:hypothetical protein LIA77_05423 [Sarocladium implicatum]|nr:hypothetical protein LIA77_05423 [Sarocladium implicatum]
MGSSGLGEGKRLRAHGGRNSKWCSGLGSLYLACHAGGAWALAEMVCVHVCPCVERMPKSGMFRAGGLRWVWMV